MALFIALFLAIVYWVPANVAATEAAAECKLKVTGGTHFNLTGFYYFESNLKPLIDTFSIDSLPRRSGCQVFPPPTNLNIKPITFKTLERSPSLGTISVRVFDDQSRPSQKCLKLPCIITASVRYTGNAIGGGTSQTLHQDITATLVLTSGQPARDPLPREPFDPSFEGDPLPPKPRPPLR